jgi:uncharacterized Ntn-hydrolase superfamily protein
MKRILLSIFLLIWIVNVTPVEATFSIVAIDPATGEVGSAGASCIPNSYIINDPIGAIGAINTQAFYHTGNQQYAHSLMELGLSPQEIIDSLIANDISGNPTIRQYGIVDLVGGGRSAAHTGVNTNNWKGHLLGTTYAIQGNILLGSGILDSMEFIFNITPGPLCDRLMAALEAAKTIGADTRCLSLNKSSISAYIHVVHPDSTDFPYLIVANTPDNVDPIDSLRVLYDAWKDSVLGVEENTNFDIHAPKVQLLGNIPNPFNQSTLIRYQIPIPNPESRILHHVSLKIYDLTGRLVETLVNKNQDPGVYSTHWDGTDNSGETVPSGIYFSRLVSRIGKSQKRTTTQKLILLR